MADAKITILVPLRQRSSNNKIPHCNADQLTKVVQRYNAAPDLAVGRCSVHQESRRHHLIIKEIEEGYWWTMEGRKHERPKRVNPPNSDVCDGGIRESPYASMLEAMKSKGYSIIRSRKSSCNS